VVGKLGEYHNGIEGRYEAYKAADITDRDVHHILIQSLDARVIPVTKIKDVLGFWRAPTHEEFAQDKTVWRLHNAYTEVFKQAKVFDLPRVGSSLHGVLDPAAGYTTPVIEMAQKKATVKKSAGNEVAVAVELLNDLLEE